ncbi:MAG: hypothetical protein JWR21_1711 [Herminiimonas sp.]|nr:hypothetical protein [Herminiimonas sp.]MDB5853622.1 hypothetical protein [Herminiimonas sp.]
MGNDATLYKLREADMTQRALARRRRAGVTDGGASSQTAPPTPCPYLPLFAATCRSFRLLADLTADSIFLPVQFFLLNLGNVAAVPARHIALFLANAVVGAVKPRGLRF